MRDSVTQSIARARFIRNELTIIPFPEPVYRGDEAFIHRTILDSILLWYS